jgi:Holliday junction resolvasome RuvABC DNA-binding subunit
VISQQTTSGGPHAVGIGRSSVDGRAARWLQARARRAIRTLTTRSGSCVTHEDVERLDAVPGVGAKVAERIVRELRDKVGGFNLMPEHVTATSSNGHVIEVSLVDDAVSALINLGYKPAEAKRAVDSVDRFDEKDGLEILIRKSLAITVGEG